MMKKRLFSPGSFAAFAIALSGGLALSACSPDPYPTPQAEEPPPPPPAELAGGPAYPPPPPPPGAYEPAPQSSAPVVIAMAPIPNPPEKPRRARPRVSGRYSAGGSTTYSYSQPSARYVAPRATAPAAPRAVAAAPAKPAQTPARSAAKPLVINKAPGKVAPPVAVAKNAKPAVPGGLKGSGAPKAAAAGAAATAAAPTGLRAAHLKDLETAMADVVKKTGKLTVPEKFTPGAAADVGLTIPAEFADTLKAEAEKAGLADAAKSVNLTAALSGEGYAVMPDETQSLPLAAGKATEFHWTVTAAQNAKGPLKADIGADLLGGGADTLNLGSLTADQGLFGGAIKNPRLLFGAIIALLAALLIAWLARGQGGQPSRSAASRRAARRAVRNDRPFDLGDETA